MDNQDCVFCRIANHTQASHILYETDEYVIIPDILPKAPVHLLVVSKKHIPSVAHLEPGDRNLMGDMIFAARDIAVQQGISERGYKLIFNVGKEGGQVIPHLHLHLLGGKELPE